MGEIFLLLSKDSLEINTHSSMLDDLIKEIHSFDH